MTNYENLSLEQQNGLVTVVIDRPKVLNALDAKTLSELTDLFTRIDGDDAARGVILTGAGEKAFVAGADIKELSEMNAQTGKAISERGQNLFNLIEGLGKPVLAAVNGYALGGGLELAMACTFRYASSKARMGQPEINLGLIPGYGGTQRLPRLIGKGRAIELLLTGDMMDAEEALRLGLVNRVLEPEALLPAAREAMEKILTKSSVIGRYILQAVNRGISLSLKDGLSLEANLFSMCAETEDMREGTAAFLEKRKPEFKGR